MERNAHQAGDPDLTSQLSRALISRCTALFRPRKGLETLLEALARATALLRGADWNEDAAGRPARDG
jgi:hypothetical protein